MTQNSEHSLYEGCPTHVIQHWHRFSVSQKIAEHDRELHGDQNVGELTEKVVGAFLSLTKILEALSDRLNSGFSQEDIGTLSSETVAYVGWWTVEQFMPLSNTVPEDATRADFLSRTARLFQLFELLKPAAMRNLVLSVGINKGDIKGLGSLKLLACLCQLSTISAESGLNLLDDTDELVPQWDSKFAVNCLNSIFAINGLRVAESHTPGAEQENDIATHLAAFEIDVATTANGWSDALHKVYARLASDLNTTAELIRNAL